MNETLLTALAFVGAYLLGSIPFGLLVGFVCGVDVRKSGSGNIGATNVIRVIGPKVGVPVLLLDMLKGLGPVLVWLHWLSACTSYSPSTVNLVAIGIGVVAVLGHNFSLYLGFKGGKGVSTSLGVGFGLAPVVAAFVVFCVFVPVLLITRYVSLGSMLAAGLSPVAHFVYFKYVLEKSPPLEITFFLVITAGLIFLRHRANIKRLIQGCENKVNFGRKKEKNG